MIVFYFFYFACAGTREKKTSQSGLKKKLEEEMSSQMINFDQKYCELESNYEWRIVERDNRIKQLENEIIQLNESKDNMIEKLMKNHKNKMSQQETTCLVYLIDTTRYFFKHF